MNQNVDIELLHQYARGKAASIAPVGTHAFYEEIRRILHPERYNYLSMNGLPKRVKGRSKRGWTVRVK